MMEKNAKYQFFDVISFFFFYISLFLILLGYLDCCVLLEFLNVLE
jgi:hypothetical protein